MQSSTELIAQVITIFGYIYRFLELTAIIWGPFGVTYFALKYWKEYVQAKFISKLDFILLEIKIPREVLKTPLAMELVLQSMWQSSQGTWYDQWLKGKLRVWFSLEIISEEGNVRFLIRTPRKFKKLIESHIYAHYPNTEVVEVLDYVTKAPFMHEHGAWDMWGCEFALTKPDPYPIRTYVDYGLDKADLEEENKIDPLATLIEYMGGFGRGQYLWYQIMIQPNKDRFDVTGSHFKKQGWKDEGKNLIKELKEKYAEGKASKRDTEVLHAIERSLTKNGYDCGLRVVYVAKNEHFDPNLISGVAGMLGHFGLGDLNGFRPTHTTDFDYPWQDYKDYRLNKKKHHIFDAYVRRSYFYEPYKETPYVLNSEELATIWHFPGLVVGTPTLGRVESRKGEPPQNLPT